MCRTDVVLKPLQMDDRDQFIKDSQWVFKYGFHIVEFFNPMHKSPDETDYEQLEATENGIDELDFRFEKVMPAL